MEVPILASADAGAEHDYEKTAFLCHRGLFEFNVMPFGQCNAPQVFSEVMSVVLQGLDSFALAYCDDIFIFSKSIEELERHLRTVFDTMFETSWI